MRINKALLVKAVLKVALPIITVEGIAAKGAETEEATEA